MFAKTSLPVDRVKRRRRRRRAPSRELFVLVLLVGVVLGSALALGAQRGVALFATISGALAAGVLAYSRLGRLPFAAVLALGLSLYSFLQAMPIPSALLSRLSPAAADVWLRTGVALAQPMRWGTLSLDPGASFVEAAKWGSLACVVLASTLVRRKWGSSALGSLLFGSGVLVCLVTLAHGLVDAHSIFGLYTPTFTPERWARGPLLNPNNLAGYANLALFVGLGLAIAQRGVLPRWALGAGSLLLVCMVFLSGSRGGVVSLLVGCIAALAWAVARRPLVVLRWAAVGAFVLLLALLAFLSLADERLVGGLLSTDLTRKAAVWRWSFALVREYWAFGAGRGAFESAFPAYRGTFEDDYSSVFSHPENLPLQWLTEWGVVVGFAGLAAGGALFVAAIKRHVSEPQAFCAALGLAALTLQNLADLSLEIPAIAIAAAVVWSILDERGLPVAAASNGRRALALGSFAMMTLVVGIRFGRFPVQLERLELSEAVNATPASSLERAKLAAQVERALGRHPADPYFWFLRGLLAHRWAEGNPLRWLDRALELSPYHGPTHLVLAEVLARRGAIGQAIIHLRHAVTYDHFTTRAVVVRAVRWSRDNDELARAFPDPPRGAGLLADACGRLTSPPRRSDCWRRVTERSDSGAHLSAYGAALLEVLESGENGCAGAERAACESEVERVSAKLSLVDPDPAAAAVLRARLLSLRGKGDAAAHMLLEQCGTGGAAGACYDLAVNLALAANDTALVVSVIKRWLSHACDGECPALHSRAAQALASRGAWGLALGHFIDAARGEPEVGRWLDVADAATRVRAIPTARLAMERARQAGALTPANVQRLEELEKRLSPADSP